MSVHFLSEVQPRDVGRFLQEHAIFVQNLEVPGMFTQPRAV